MAAGSFATESSGRSTASQRSAWGATWKANVETRKHRLIEPPEQLAAWTRRAMEHLQADALGLDFLERADGSWVLLECNDTPGLSGFPERAKAALADCLLRRMSA
jgi:ribosomal protein S6--L-glutamate ligase